MRLRAVLIGTQHPHSLGYQEILSQLPDIEICAILSEGGEIIEALSHVPVVETLEDILSKVLFDAAIVTVPADKATNVLIELAQAGKHLLCDKPVCRTAAEMRDVAAAVKKARVRFAVGYQNRFRPSQLKAREVVRGGQLGTVFALTSQLFTTSIATRNASSYLFDRARSGGGILHWLGCHFIEMYRDILGREIVEVKSLLGVLGTAKVSVEDVAGVVLQFEGGIIATLIAGYTMPREVDDPLRYSKKDTSLSIWGSLAKLEFEPFGKSLQLLHYGGNSEQPVREVYSLPYPVLPGSGDALYRELVQDFFASIRDDRAPRGTADDALCVLEVLDRVYDD